jgi:ribonucleotide reductase beta subunit family protein with ferritin-like domain
MSFNFDPSKEFLLDQSSNNNYTFYPIKFPDILKLAKTAMSAHWVAEEIDYYSDLDDWNNKLTDNERFFIKNVLAFFSSSDGIVNENLAINFYNEVKVAEARYLYANQIQMEAIHCVSGDTKILTSTGYHDICDLVDQFVDVWNGYEYSNVQVKQTSEADTLYRVTLDNGMYLDCTSEHKWYNSNNEVILTKDLITGEDSVTYLKGDYQFPTEYKFSSYHSPINFYTRGFTCNEEFMQDSTELYTRVPLNARQHEKQEFLKGLLDYHANVIYSNCDKFLHRLQLMLTTLNMCSDISYDDDRCQYYLEIIKNKVDIQVVSVKELPGFHKTYCFNEPKRHLGIFNGILTGQSETYSLLIDTFITNKKEKNDIFNAIETNPIVKKKAEWCMKWLDPKTRSFPERLLAFGIVEGVFFSGSFCAIFWLKYRGLMPALTLSNRFISRDENLHCLTCVLLYSKLTQRLPEKIVHDMFSEAIEIENEFITKSIPVDLLGMNSKKMTQYIKYVADFWLVKLNYNKLSNVENPFQWMESSGIEVKSNFFERPEHSYAKPGILNDSEDQTLQFDMDI